MTKVLDERLPILLFIRGRKGCFEDTGSSREPVVAVTSEGADKGVFAFWRNARYDASSAMLTSSGEAIDDRRLGLTAEGSSKSGPFPFVLTVSESPLLSMQHPIEKTTTSLLSTHSR